MKRKNYIFSLASALLMGTMALSLTACSSEDNIVNNTQQPAQGEVRTYNVSIPATFSDNADTRAVEFDNTGATPAITTTFKTTDRIYVYNETKARWANDGSNLVVLAPANDATKTTLTGTLQFAGITPAVGDVILLLYNIPYAMGLYPENSYFSYYKQSANTITASGYDFAEATMKIKSISGSDITLCQASDETKTTAQFENLQSMFRQRLSFTESGSPVTPTIKSIVISSNYSIVSSYYPFRKTDTNKGNVIGSINFTDPAIDMNGDIYVALRFYGSTDGDYLKFRAYADDGKFYECTKAAPTGGFKNGKYYYGTITLDYQGTIKLPTFTGVTPEQGANLNSYNLKANDFTISGESYNVYFRLPLGYGGNITLNNLNAIDLNNAYSFLRAENMDYTLVLVGDNTVITKQNGYCFQNSNHEIKLSGNGTLTVTAKNLINCGIVSTNYAYSDNSNKQDVSGEIYVTDQLAADPSITTVKRSARTDNGDGTYTWTYTVTTTTP